MHYLHKEKGPKSNGIFLFCFIIHCFILFYLLYHHTLCPVLILCKLVKWSVFFSKNSILYAVLWNVYCFNVYNFYCWFYCTVLVKSINKLLLLLEVRVFFMIPFMRPTLYLGEKLDKTSDKLLFLRSWTETDTAWANNSILTPPKNCIHVYCHGWKTGPNDVSLWSTAFFPLHLKWCCFVSVSFMISMLQTFITTPSFLSLFSLAAHPSAFLWCFVLDISCYLVCLSLPHSLP